MLNAILCIIKNFNLEKKKSADEKCLFALVGEVFNYVEGKHKW